MLSADDIGSSAAGAVHGITSAESCDIAAETGQTNLPNAENAPALPLDDDTAFQHRTDSPAQRHDGFQRVGHSWLKPLAAMATTQYVLVTALAAFTAFMVASETGKAINAKLEPIFAALKRL